MLRAFMRWLHGLPPETDQERHDRKAAERWSHDRERWGL